MKRVDALCMAHGCQPVQFHQSNGKRSLKQHIMDFIETCNNTDTCCDLSMKQFMESLKGVACDLHVTLLLDLLIVGGKWKMSF